MDKINKFINKNIELILCMFVIAQPIIDVLTSICINLNFIVSFGTVIRFMFMLFMLYYLIFLTKLYRKKYISVIVLILIYMFFYLLSNNNVQDIIGLVKSFYFTIMFMSLFSVYKNNNRVSDKSIFTSLLIYVTIILIASITNTSFNSYDIAKTGSVGWFISANEIGAIIAILLPFMFNLVYKKFDYFKLIVLIFTIITSFMIGTRIPLISLGICLIYYYFKVMKGLYKKKKRKIFTSLIISSIAVIISFIIILPNTPIYKNIQIHSEYLKIDSIDDIFRDNKTIDHFIFSSRLSYLEDTKEVYRSSNIYNKLIGIGYTTNEKMVEMDIFDIFYRHGIIGFLIYFGSIAYLLSLNKIKKINKEYILPIFMTVFISMFAGHVFTSPNVSLVVVIMILNMWYENEKKKKLLFTAFNLDIGGVEKCLINLVNNLDKDKYDITILLQVKEGIFLNYVNSNVKVLGYNLSKSKNKIIKLVSNCIKFLKIIISNYDRYDFSCCYATGYVHSSIVGLIGSNNNAIWMHTNVVEYMKYYQPYENTNWTNIKKVKKFVNRMFFRLFRKRVFVSSNSMKDYLNIYPKDKNKCIVCYNLTDYDEIIGLSEEKINDLNINNNYKIFLNVSRHSEHDKKLTRILNAIEKLKNERYKFKFIFIGDGKEHENYKKIVKEKNISDYVIFTGKKKNPFPYYKICDATVLSSNFEGFPTIYLESMILNKPIITTNVSDASSIIDKKYGIVVDNSDESIYYGMKKFLDEGFTIKEKFDACKYNKNNIKILESVINNEV